MAVESAHYGGHSVIFYILEKRIYGMPDAKRTVEVPYDKSFVLPTCHHTLTLAKYSGTRSRHARRSWPSFATCITKA